MKNNLVFGLFDVLTRGKLNVDLSLEYLKPLSDFCEKNNKNLFLITGMQREIGKKIVNSSGLNEFFNPKNIIYISKEYLNSLSELDIKLRNERSVLDKEYSDSYFKVFYLNNNFKYKQSETLFVGHDIWTDAFYLRRYTKTDFVLLDKTLSNNHVFFDDLIPDLNIIKPSFSVFKDYLTSKKKFNYISFDNFITKLLQRNILGNSLDISKINFSKIISKNKK